VEVGVVIYLDHPVLGRLDLMDKPNGYDVSEFQIGFPEVREVVIPRPLLDGAFDLTQYLGTRAVTVAMYLDQRRAPTQLLLDRLMPYLHPLYRPRLVYTIQDIQQPCVDIPALPAPRALTVRGVDGPTIINGPRFQTISVQWVADTYAQSVDENCYTFLPSDDSEAGRTYDLAFDRIYPPTLPSGSQTIINAGNAPAHWRLTIFPDVDDPVFEVNGFQIDTDGGGGTSIGTGQTLVIDTLQRSVRIDDDPASSVLGNTNFGSWEWSDLLLHPGANSIRYQGDNLSSDARATICWYDTWI
jgi:hypothetical protein